jgi:uncharacterized membrane protein YdjX (TVP38/TMEM64 family)
MLATDEQKDIWTSRRKIARNTLKPILKRTLEKKQKAPLVTTDATAAAEPVDGTKKKKTPTGLVVSAFLIAITAAVLRLGGRTAFVSLLGLDFIADSDVKNQVSDFVNNFNNMDDLVRYGAFFGAWLGAKAFCIDAFTVILALSSGVLFGGIVQGAAVSVVCSSLASLCVFLTARYYLREQTEQQIERRPAFRAVERAVAREGFKTVFTLRLSPLLPIPIAAYNYLYGVTSVSALDFLAGISLGSVKPYLLDSYLGLFGKSLIDDPTGGGMYSDAALFAFISILILVGTFATEVAASTWQEIQLENEEEERKRREELVALGLSAEPLVDEQKLTNGPAALADSQLFRMMGVTAADVDKLPGWVKGIIGDIFSAQNRVNSVIDDEVAAVEYELLEGIDLGWDCIPRRGPALKVVEGSGGMTGVTGETGEAGVDGVAHLKYAYPGERSIYDFEKVLPSASNFKEYTYESLVFSFSLMGAMGKLMDSEEEGGTDAGSKSSPAVSLTQ